LTYVSFCSISRLEEASSTLAEGDNSDVARTLDWPNLELST